MDELGKSSQRGRMQDLQLLAQDDFSLHPADGLGHEILLDTVPSPYWGCYYLEWWLGDGWCLLWWQPENPRRQMSGPKGPRGLVNQKRDFRRTGLQCLCLCARKQKSGCGRRLETQGGEAWYCPGYSQQMLRKFWPRIESDRQEEEGFLELTFSSGWRVGGSLRWGLAHFSNWSPWGSPKVQQPCNIQ